MEQLVPCSNAIKLGKWDTVLSCENQFYLLVPIPNHVTLLTIHPTLVFPIIESHYKVELTKPKPVTYWIMVIGWTQPSSGLQRAGSHQWPLSDVIVPGDRFCLMSRNFFARPLSHLSMFFYVPVIYICMHLKEQLTLRNLGWKGRISPQPSDKLHIIIIKLP
jgi:hypothetical protein